MSFGQIQNSASPSGGQWRKCETKMLEGWSLKEVMFGSRKQVLYLSPTGLVLKGKRMVLNYMVTQHFPQEHIDEMRNSLKTDETPL